MKHHTFEDGLKYKPDYKWPEPGSERECPKCKVKLELQEDLPSSEEDFQDLKTSNTEE